MQSGFNDPTVAKIYFQNHSGTILSCLLGNAHDCRAQIPQFTAPRLDVTNITDVHFL